MVHLRLGIIAPWTRWVMRTSDVTRIGTGPNPARNHWLHADPAVCYALSSVNGCDLPVWLRDTRVARAAPWREKGRSGRVQVRAST